MLITRAAIGASSHNAARPINTLGHSTPGVLYYNHYESSCHLNWRPRQ